ncbi:MAG: valine--tRNA ligase [Bacteroidetes bacterium]|nr:MAG: valine--tRNA ligase [Bacteroidota bacterium]
MPVADIPKTYNPKEVESKWYSYWVEKKFFRSVPDEREPYTIVIPPPNVTGVLHMGHMLNNTIQDVLIRRARMMGKNACWVPGTDHASIATEAKVVALLAEKKIKKSDISRDEFLKFAWEWKEKYGGIILEQLKKLGCSCDWDRTRFTMEDSLSEAVIDVFIDLHKKGHIYRGMRMVNWDPKGLTALSDEEVNYKEVNSKLFYVRYKLVNEDNTPLSFSPSQSAMAERDGEVSGDEAWITIATTRPETILGDTAICVHPEDERYQKLKGKKAMVPLVNRPVPIIFDEYVDKEFGSGALKVTPAHDINDYNLGIKHRLDSINVLNPDGTMSKAARFFIGEDRFVTRKKIVKELEEKGYLIKTDDIRNKVGYSERTGAVIEPKLSMQWFLKMYHISKPALDNVLNGEIKLIPDKFINTYRHWMENVHDWCISRQLWWGQRIPAWYDEKENCVVAKTKAEAIDKFKILNPESQILNLRQDEDVLDTWFSSWLWPISVFDGFKDPKNKDITYYYPTNDLISAPDILFFWIARMIVAGYEFRKEKPFRNIYINGIVRDKLGRKMSKSLGNSPDPIELIEKYGADGVRVGMLLCAPAGNDLLFDESYCEQGSKFSNKIWNAFRLIKGWEVSPSPVGKGRGEVNKIAIDWFNAKFKEQLEIINDQYAKYRMSEALMTCYKLVWDDFCAWYLEIVKPEFMEGKPNPIDKETYDATINFFEDLLKVIHPFMPFISEEIWHLIRERKEKDCIMLSSWPSDKFSTANTELMKMAMSAEIISHVRNFRNSKGISPKEKHVLYIKKDSSWIYPEIISKLANLSEIKLTEGKIDNAFSFVVNKMEFFIPMGANINVAGEKEHLSKELDYHKGFLQSVQKKLANERFLQNAKPEILEMEKKKQADAEAKIKAIENQLSSLK